MTLYYAAGSTETDLDEAAVRSALRDVFRQLGPRKRVLVVPPDHTRSQSMAGLLCRIAFEYFGPRLVDVLPALGTHLPMSAEQIEHTFPGVPLSLFRVHDWRNDVVTIGLVPAEFTAAATEGVWNKPWPVQLNRLVWEGGHDLIISISQVVPHEVVGMAGYIKNLLVGVGGAESIHQSHFIGAGYGMERMMGRAETPLTRIFEYAGENFCRRLPLLYVLTVVTRRNDGSPAMRGLFIGDDHECFRQAAKLSAQVNITVLDEAPNKIIAYLSPLEFSSTWLGNKAIYRTRMAIADGGELVILAPAVARFGEDQEIDRLIRKYGYRPAAEIMRLVEEKEDLRGNLAAAAHLIHGSSEGRFTITYCPGQLSQKEIEAVGYRYADLSLMLKRYDPGSLYEGWNTLPDGERLFYISNPALGLWVDRRRASF